MIDNFYFCSECNLPQTAARDENGKQTLVLSSIEHGRQDLIDEGEPGAEENFTIKNYSRPLNCGHFLDSKILPLSSEELDKLNATDCDSQFKLNPSFTDLITDSEMKDYKTMERKTILQMSDDELQAHILDHVAQFQMHQKAAMLGKYGIQLAIAEHDERKRLGKLSPSVAQDFEYLFKKIGKKEMHSKEVLVREKIKLENSVEKRKKKIDDGLEAMRRAVQKNSGKTISMEDLKKKFATLELD